MIKDKNVMTGKKKKFDKKTYNAYDPAKYLAIDYTKKIRK